MDGKWTINGQIFSIVTRMVKAIGDGVMWVQCVLHQLDLVIQVEYIKLYDD